VALSPNLTFLRDPLAPGGERLASVDPRLATLDGLAKRGDWPAVAERVQELLAGRTYDIRALSYYLYAAFAVGGLRALPEVLDAAHATLADRFAEIGPEAKHDEHFDRRLAWLFDQIEGSLRYHEHKQTPEWAAWHAQPPLDALERALARAMEIGSQLENRQFASAPRTLSALVGWLRNRLEGLRPGEEPPRASVADSAAPSPSPPAAAATPGRKRHRDTNAPEAVSDRTLTLAVSERFIELTRKLRAFESLVERNQYDKAAVIVDDIMQRIEHFDPREYFPGLFVPFSALLSRHIEPITQHLGDRESAPWRALVQYYQVDLDGFAGEEE
jgi:hypothetical protein